MVHGVLKVLAVAAILLGVLVLPARAQERISNAKLETRSAAQGIEREVRAVASRGGVVWVGYSVPVARSRRSFDDNSYGECWLGGWGASGDSRTAGDVFTRGSRVVRLEPPAELLVLARIENGEIVRVRAFTADCEVDANGAAVVWFTDVKPDDSVSWLATLANSRAANRTDRCAQSAMSAIAFAKYRPPIAFWYNGTRRSRTDRCGDRRSSGLRHARPGASAITGAIERSDVEVRKGGLRSASAEDEGVRG
jgi:hypothetical protein